MFNLSIGFLLGILLLQQFPQLPSLSWAWCLLVTLPTLLLIPRFRLVSAMLNGFLYALCIAHSVLGTQLPVNLEGNDLVIEGTVVSIPDKREDGWRFRLQIDDVKQLNHPNYKINLSGVVRLGWYRAHSMVRAGEKWQLVARLKRPSGFMNPGGFDYEKWLFSQRISATGYVRHSNLNRRIHATTPFSITHIRESIHQYIQKTVVDSGSAAILSALSVAYRDTLSDQQWELFRATGTSHLIAISGLHIGMVAGFAFFPVMIIWWLFPGLYLKLPVKIAGGILGAMLATAYALVAGFTLPTQRALIMVLVILFGLLTRRHYSSASILATALFLVLLHDPLAVLAQGFWLSFIAVALILMTLGRTLKHDWSQIVKVQMVLSVGMLPVTLGFFGSASLISPLANLLAIPWVTIIVVPLTLIGVIFSFVSSLIADWVLNLAGSSVELLVYGLNALNKSWATIAIAEIPNSLLFVIFAGFLLLLMPKGMPGRWLGAIFLLPLIWYQAPHPESGAFNFHLLDVGQGQAVVIQTQNHVLVYDAGPRAGKGFDAGKLAVVPFLRSKGIRQIDLMMISHEDKDHRGGAKYITQAMYVKRIVSSDTAILPGQDVELCETGASWEWDGVIFSVLHPKKDWQENDNNRSCVLRISTKTHSLLLTGDIQKKAENYLIKHHSDQLKANVILVPHHGSNSSSQQKFITAVNPEIAVAGTGYRNRFGFPKEKVVSRYEAANTRFLHTSANGEISMLFPAYSAKIEVKSYRQVQRHYWNRK
jgi:competence protein ComEC